MVRVVQEIDSDLPGDNLRLNLYQKLHNWQSPIMPPARQALAEPSRRISRKQTLLLINGPVVHFRQTCLVGWRNGSLFLKKSYSGI
jgi:hypothetical protein